MCDEEDTLEVGVDQFIPVLFTRVFYFHACWIDACAVEYIIQASELLDCVVYKALYFSFLADIDSLRVGPCAALCSDGFNVRLINVAKGD